MVIFLIACSVVCAVVPMLVFLATIWWMDRYDREPLWLLGLTFLCLHQLRFQPIGGLPDLPAQSLLPFALCTALRQYGGQRFHVLIQTFNAIGRFLLFLADPCEISLAVFAYVAGSLHIQLCFRDPLLQIMHSLIQLRNPAAYRLQRTFLSGFFGNPLRQLCLTRAGFLLEASDFERAALGISHQRFDALREVSQEKLQS